jgi:hypothetical protein
LNAVYKDPFFELQIPDIQNMLRQVGLRLPDAKPCWHAACVPTNSLSCHKNLYDGVFKSELHRKIILEAVKLKVTNLRFVLLVTVLLMFGCSAIASEGSIASVDDKKYEFCGDNNWSGNGKRVAAKDLREIKMSATSLLTVDGRKNGGISVKGENRSDIQIRACVRAWGDTKEKAEATVRNTKINSGALVRAENSVENAKYSVSYQVLVPQSQNLKLTAHNGGISISAVRGNLEFETRNGGVSLSEVAGSVKGTTRNGGVSVKLSGNRWNGSGLDVETRNGGVSLSLPANYAANVETGTVNGGIKSDFKALQAEKKGRWYKNKQISASINGGGPKIRVVTTNGGVRIKSSDL